MQPEMNLHLSKYGNLIIKLDPVQSFRIFFHEDSFRFILKIEKHDKDVVASIHLRWYYINIVLAKELVCEYRTYAFHILKLFMWKEY